MVSFFDYFDVVRDEKHVAQSRGRVSDTLKAWFHGKGRCRFYFAPLD